MAARAVVPTASPNGSDVAARVAISSVVLVDVTLRPRNAIRSSRLNDRETSSRAELRLGTRTGVPNGFVSSQRAVGPSGAASPVTGPSPASGACDTEPHAARNQAPHDSAT